MKLFLSLVTMLLGVAYSQQSSGQPTVSRLHNAAPASDWQLVWSDEFDGERLDSSKWSYELGQGKNGWGNGEWQVYTNEAKNLWLQDGLLHIRAMKHGAGNGGYSSARITTKDKYQVQFGKIAARIRLPKGRAIWPAFWMMGANSDLEPWPFSGEIDIAEMRGGKASDFTKGDGGDMKIYGSLHYFHSKANGHVGWTSSTALDRPFADDFHIFEVEWYDTHIIYKLDGKTYSLAEYNGINEMHEFRAWPYYLLLQVAVGGTGTDFTGRLPPDDSIFPQTMQVDWVRVYQKPEMNPAIKNDYAPQGLVYNVSNERQLQGGNAVEPNLKLDIWNKPGFSIHKIAAAAEGQEAVLLRSDGSQDWFGVGYTTGKKVDLGGYRYLTLSLKTSSKAIFKIGSSHSYGSWIYFIPGNDPYGFKRDGQWHTLHIPREDFLQPEFDWGSIDAPFALVAAGIKGPTEIAVDGVYFDGKSTNPDDYLLIPTSDPYFFDKDDRGAIKDELENKLRTQIWTYRGFDVRIIHEDCYRGNDCRRLSADSSGSWFGFAYAGVSPIKLLGYKTLELALRTRSTGRLKLGIMDSKGQEQWFDLATGPYTLPRDGAWHRIQIPLSALSDLDLTSISTMLAIVGDEAKAYQVDIDGARLSK